MSKAEKPFEPSIHIITKQKRHCALPPPTHTDTHTNTHTHTNQLLVFEQVDIETEGEEQLVLLEERAAHVDIQRVGEVVSKDLQSEQIITRHLFHIPNWLYF